MPSRLYSRAQLEKMAEEEENPFRTTNPKQALVAIKKKYGSDIRGHFYHRGKGNWTRYSYARDRKLKHKKRKWKSGRSRYLHHADYQGKKGL